MITLPPSPPEQPARKAMPLPQPGRGTRVVANAVGYSISTGRGRGGNFKHPFRAVLDGRLVSLARGLVESREPLIGTVPISGDATHPAPALELQPDQRNDRGESYVCVELVPTKEGALDGKGRLEIVHQKEPKSLDPMLARKALAVVVWNEELPVQIFQLVYFNLSYVRYLPPAGFGPVRHFFL